MTKPTLFYRCTGQGSPTVVMDAGLGETSDTWANVESGVAEQASTLVYDRANIGRSERVSHPRTSRRMVAELRDLLRLGKIKPPYILVGHSFGGLNMMLFARLYPGEVAGMVLIDSSHPNQTARFMSVLSPELKQKYVQGFASDEGMTFDQRIQCEDELRSATPMPDIPLYVLMSGRRREGKVNWPYREWDRIWHEQQLELAHLTTNSKFLSTEKSGHFIHNDEPELVIEAISTIIELARKLPVTEQSD
jgi:pimeloyl-ACP methyl ester carboxylesterase